MTPRDTWVGVAFLILVVMGVVLWGWMPELAGEDWWP